MKRKTFWICATLSVLIFFLLEFWIVFDAQLWLFAPFKLLLVFIVFLYWSIRPWRFDATEQIKQKEKLKKIKNSFRRKWRNYKEQLDYIKEIIK